MRVKMGDHVRVQELTKGTKATFQAARIDSIVAAKLFLAAMRLARPSANESCRTNYAV
jgi:hypothetical protein